MRIIRFHPQQQALPLAAHAFMLRLAFPQGILKKTSKTICWEGSLSPLDGSREYSVRLEYEIGSAPSITVVRPNLIELAGDRRLPHCYDQIKQRLCLYYPPNKRWTPQKNVACTVMPWALAWLAFFEIWLSTNIWYGRGIGHPGDDPSIHKVVQESIQ